MNEEIVQLRVSRGVAHETRDQLIDDLRKVLNVPRVEETTLKGVGIPEFIQLILDAKEWLTPLNAAAAFFVHHASKFLSSYGKKIAEKAAEATWEDREKIKSVLQEGAVKPLRLVASAFAKAKAKISGPTQVRVGLPIPDDYFATMLEIEETDEVGYAIAIAYFVLKAEQIEQEIKRHAADKGIEGAVKLTLEPGGAFVASWYDEDYEHHQIRIE